MGVERVKIKAGLGTYISMYLPLLTLSLSQPATLLDIYYAYEWWPSNYTPRRSVGHSNHLLVLLPMTRRLPLPALPLLLLIRVRLLLLMLLDHITAWSRRSASFVIVRNRTLAK